MTALGRVLRLLHRSRMAMTSLWCLWLVTLIFVAGPDVFTPGWLALSLVVVRCLLLIVLIILPLVFVFLDAGEEKK